MQETSVRPAGDIERIMQTYGDMLYRLCLVSLGNISDAEDAVQETMIKYVQRMPKFQEEEHEKAWLLRVASNKCKDIHRFKKRHPIIDMDEMAEVVTGQVETDSDIWDALMTLPEKFRIVLILYYVEECSMEHIAKVIGRTVSAVKKWLQKGRSLLREAYQKEGM